MAKTDKPEGYTFGRPTKYKPELVTQLLEYVDSVDIPFLEEIALRMGIHQDTYYEWVAAHEDFSEANKRLKTKQKVALLKASLGKKFNVSGAIFQLKANHGMIETERKIQDVRLKEAPPVTVTFETIDGNQDQGVSETEAGAGDIGE